MISKDIDKFISDPRNRDVLQIVKSMRNGLVYGAKLRFAHTLVMQFIFKRNLPLSKKMEAVLKMAKAHGSILASYALLYRVLMLVLAKIDGNTPLHEFISGCISGFVVYGNLTPYFNHAIAHQITLFCGARVTLALGKIIAYKVARHLKTLNKEQKLLFPDKAHTRKMIQRYSWSIFASLSWGSVMFLHRYYGSFLQHGLESSMEFIYDDHNWNDLRSLLGI
jgi:peroxisomal membrane protein 4